MGCQSPPAAGGASSVTAPRPAEKKILPDAEQVWKRERECAKLKEAGFCRRDGGEQPRPAPYTGALGDISAQQMERDNHEKE